MLNSTVYPQQHEARREPRAGRRPCAVTDRDVAILRELFDSRILTAAHLADIHFNSSRVAVRQRIPVLKAAKLIAARPRATPYEPEVLTLAKAGFDLLLNKGELADFPAMTWDAMEKRCRVSPLTLRHELAVGDFKAAVHAAARRAEGVRVVEFLTWPALSRFTSRRTLPGGYTRSVDVKADAFARLVHATTGGDAEHVFFVEVDRSTETLDRIVVRASAYAMHYQSGNFAKWMGGDGADVAAYPFRVLWLFKSAQRMLNFARGCLNARPPIRRMMWLATLNDAITDPLGPVWTTPADCEALVSTMSGGGWSPTAEERIVRKPLL